MILLGLSIPTCFLLSIPERRILEALLRRVLYCGHSTQYSHLVIYHNDDRGPPHSSFGASAAAAAASHDICSTTGTLTC